MENKYQEFWDWFQTFQHKFFELNMDNADMYLTKLNTRIRRVDKHLSGLLSPEHKGIMELVITAEGNKEGFPNAFGLVNESPEIEGWVFRALKPRIGPKTLFELNGKRFDSEDFYFHYEEENEKLNITFYHPYKNIHKEELFSVSLHLLDTIIGEYDTSTYIGFIEFEKYKHQKGSLPLTKIVTVVDSFKNSKRV